MGYDDTIKSAAIYPPIGIARIGNSPEYYIGAEIPGRPAEVKDGYKDKQGRVKKQVALFRIYGLDKDGKVVKELTEENGAKIQWRVHVANRKAGWYQFKNALDLEGLAQPSAFRNSDVTGKDRAQLIIDPGPREISGKNVQGKKYHLTGGKFFDKEVPLGEIRTDDKGRLLFFGGDGNSESKDGAQAVTFANNDGWHDDVSDGPVRAKVYFEGKTMEAEPAMAAVTPPNFGQGLYGVVSMRDVVQDLYIRCGWEKRPQRPDFYTHIYPIFERMTQTQWVNEGFFFLFGKNSPSDLTAPDLLKKLADPSPAAKEERMRLFKWFRNPENKAFEPAEIPPFYGDAFGDYKALANVCLSVTETQYQWLKQWANGDFTTGKPKVHKNFDDMSPQEQTDALNVASLDECLGGPFHPGIELTWPLRNLITWEKPYRLKVLPEGEDTRDDYGPLLAPAIALAKGGPIDGSGPGSLTRWMGVPWQTDESSCLSGYDPSTYLPLPSFWAARVPNQVLSEDSFKRLSDDNLNTAQRLKHFDYRQDWLRDLGSQYVTKINNMIKEWHELGIIAKHEAEGSSADGTLPETFWVESDRGPFIKVDPTFEQVKRAENADEKQLEKAERKLAKVSGRPKRVPKERRQRERREFERDQR